MLRAKPTAQNQLSEVNALKQLPFVFQNIVCTIVTAGKILYITQFSQVRSTELHNIKAKGEQFFFANVFESIGTATNERTKHFEYNYKNSLKMKNCTHKATKINEPKDSDQILLEIFSRLCFSHLTQFLEKVKAFKMLLKMSP